MADKITNPKYTTPVEFETLRGIAQYCFAHAPDRGNVAEKIEPAYKIDLMLPDEKEASRAEALGLLVKDANEKHPHNFVTLKSKVKEGRKPPRVVDSQRNPIPKTILIGNGSDVIVRFIPYEYGKGKVTGILQEIMVVNLVKYEPTAEESTRKGFLAPVQGGFVVPANSGEPVA